MLRVRPLCVHSSIRQEADSPSETVLIGNCGFSGKKKAHKHKLFCPVGPSFHRICPRDKPGLSLGQIRWKLGETQEFSLFYTVEARFHRICPWDKPGLSLGQSRWRRAAQKVYVKKVYVPFSLASFKRFWHEFGDNFSCTAIQACSWLRQRHPLFLAGESLTYVRIYVEGAQLASEPWN